MRFRQILNAYSSIITKNISLFLALGFLNILYSSGGWFPNRSMESFATILYRIVLPLFLAYSAGQKSGQSIGQPIRNNMGGIAGVLAACCMLSQQWGVSLLLVIAASAAAGYLASWIYNHAEKRFPSGFEMMGRNLITAVVGLSSGLFFCRSLLPVVREAGDRLMPVLEAAVESRLLFLVNLLVEPLKVFFLNNSLNHGIFIPLGMNQVLEYGKSVLFLIETNPGPGLGVLAAYWLWKKEERSNTAAVIAAECIGGIHELYFPYVLSNLKLLAAVMTGGICGTFCFVWLDAGLVGAASPGSVITILMMASPDQWWKIGIGIAVSALTSGFLAFMILKSEDQGDMSCQECTGADEAEEENGMNMQDAKIFPKNITSIYVVCDAGLGSSAMGAALLRKQLKVEEIFDIEVRAAAADDIPQGGSMIVCQKDFYEQRLQERAGELPFIYTVEQLAGKGIYVPLAQQIRESRS